MKFVSLIAIFIVSVFHVIKPSCEKITNGKYYTVIDSMFKYKATAYELTIADTVAFFKRDFLLYDYQIEQLNNCKYIFRDTHPKDTFQMTKSEKDLFGLGIPYYEITQVGTDTLNFVYMQNAHIIIYSGKFIKK